MKYSSTLLGWLADLGYTHCFFVAGGNSMHLLDGARQTMTCVPFVHEVAAGIAAEYFNESNGEGRAFVLITAGPGLTNIVTAMAGAFLESRELLVIGGQVKSSDLATDGLRQRGIQEIDGVAIAGSLCKVAVRVEKPVDRSTFVNWVLEGRAGRPGPVFIEMCLDAQARDFDDPTTPDEVLASKGPTLVAGSTIDEIRQAISVSDRPVLLLGGGVSRSAMPALLQLIEASGIPVMTTWNGADRISFDHPLYLGRPNTWGQRSSNVILAQADLIIAAGTRLGLQQTGFNWQQFGFDATIVQIDIDETELDKGHPDVDIRALGDAPDAVRRVLPVVPRAPWKGWLDHARMVRTMLPLSEPANSVHEGYLNPYDFVLALSELCDGDEMVVPCSSGGAFTVMMQTFLQRGQQTIITNKGLASMGYGLSGAIGASLAHPGRRTLLIEGDGGFSQNLQELATVDAHRLPLKIFIFDNDGYASIRMTQRNYFDGGYLGCDSKTGLGFPDWPRLFAAFSIPSLQLDEKFADSSEFAAMFGSAQPAAFIVPVHPEQSYFPKVTSRVTAGGGMESNPIYLMDPPVDAVVWNQIYRPSTYVKGGMR
jgi:acetolactate synthase I/II/III large subunit